MTEKFLHFIWKFKLFNKSNLQTTNGDAIQIINVGLVNNTTGPDFLSAHIKIADTEWVGNVEIHIKSSDWKLHKHHVDRAYNNVILHVVQQHDSDIYRENGELIPTLILNYDRQLETRYEQLLVSPIIVPCQPSIKNIEPFYIRYFLSRILVERLERKSADIVQALGSSKNNWREAFYQLLFRSFGFGVNSLPFQMLAKNTPLRIIEKYSSNIFQTEALLFGQAGFLNDEPLDDYQTKLKAEYSFLQSTYNLTLIDKSLWKFGRLRPANFPTIRIAQLAKLVSTITELIEQIITFTTLDDFVTVISARVSKYWEVHYDFGVSSNQVVKVMGRKSVEGVILNAVVPFLFTYGKAKGDTNMQDRALMLLDALKPESNSVVDMWKEIGIKADSAFYTQALIQLKAEYCDKKRCLECGIGKIVIEQG